MARISDPDKLGRSDAASNGAENGNVFFDLTNKTIELIPTSIFTGNLANVPDTPANALVDDGYNDGGVDLQALYSFIKEQWKSQSDLIAYPFPMEAITAEQFEFINGWTLTDGTESPSQFNSKKLIRNAGFSERDANGVVQKEYAGVISLGTIEDDQATPYYAFSSDIDNPINAQYTGPVNEAVLVFDQVASPTVDLRNDVLTLYVRPVPRTISTVKTGWLFAQQSTTDIGVSTIATQAYRFPLASAVDINIDTIPSDLTSGVYTNMRIEYYTSPQSITIDGTNTFSVGVVVDANITDSATEPTVKQIYNWVQNELRSASDINVSPGDETGVTGKTADPLLTFVGPLLKTLEQDRGQSPVNNGVFIEGVGQDDLNNVEFIDNTGTSQQFEFKVALNLDFNQNILDDADSQYFLFFTNANGNQFGTANAIVVDDADDLDISGFVHFAAPESPTGDVSGTGNGSLVASTGVFTATSLSTNFASNEFAGDILRISNGPNAGSYFIASNTTDTITIVSDSGKQFDANDTGLNWSIVTKNTANTTPRITKTFNYAANDQGGRTANTNADVTLVALGLQSAQYATAQTIITRTNSVSIPVSNALERNYNDPTGV